MFRPSVLRLRGPVLPIGAILLMAAGVMAALVIVAMVGGAGTLMGEEPRIAAALEEPLTASPLTTSPLTTRPVRSMLTPQQVAVAEKLADLGLHHRALLKVAYRQLAALVVKDFDGGELDLQSPPLILREWSLLDAWLAHQALERRAGEREPYAQLLSKLDPSLQVLSVELGANSTLLAVNASGIGHVMVVQKGQSAPLWRVDRVPQVPQVPQVPVGGVAAQQLGCWRPEAGTRPCAPLRAGLLPPDAQGMPRFYIEAEHASAGGATRSRQLSLWRWDGRSATPLYVTFYAARSGAQGEGARIDGDLITIERGYRAGCAACDGPARVQRLQLTAANEVKELHDAAEDAPADDPGSRRAEL